MAEATAIETKVDTEVICNILKDGEICMVKFGIGDKPREQMKIHRALDHTRYQCESRLNKKCYKHYKAPGGRNKHMRTTDKEEPEPEPKIEKAKETVKPKRKPLADVADARKNKGLGMSSGTEKTIQETKIPEPEFEKDHLTRLEDDLASSKKEVAELKCAMAKLTTDSNGLRAEFESLHRERENSVI